MNNAYHTIPSQGGKQFVGFILTQKSEASAILPGLM